MYREIDCRTHRPVPQLERVIEGAYPRREIPTIDGSRDLMNHSPILRGWLTIRPGNSPFDPTVVVEEIEGMPNEFNPLSNGGDLFLANGWNLQRMAVEV